MRLKSRNPGPASARELAACGGPGSRSWRRKASRCGRWLTVAKAASWRSGAHPQHPAPTRPRARRRASTNRPGLGSGVRSAGARGTGRPRHFDAGRFLPAIGCAGTKLQMPLASPARRRRPRRAWSSPHPSAARALPAPARSRPVGLGRRHRHRQQHDVRSPRPRPPASWRRSRSRRAGARSVRATATCCSRRPGAPGRLLEASAKEPPMRPQPIRPS